MDLKIRGAQKTVLGLFKTHSQTFALAGGTALELYYFNHRFSKDLDFFSPIYDPKEILALVKGFEKVLGNPLKLESEMQLKGRAKVRFYIVPIKGASFPLKIDFVQDVVFDHPEIKKFKGVPVYSVKSIYLQKVIAITGTILGESPIGAEEITGRDEARDVVDLYYLSKEVTPLSEFMKELPRPYQRGLNIWYRKFSRHDFKMGVLELELYDQKLDSTEIIRYLDNEIKNFFKEEIR